MTSKSSIKIQLQGKQQDLKNQIGHFTNHWRCFTSQTQTVLMPLIKKLLKENRLPKAGYPLLQQLLIDKEEQDIVIDDRIVNVENAINTFGKLFKWTNLAVYFSEHIKQVKSSQRKTVFKKEKRFQPINALHPEYKEIQLMSQFYENMPLQYESEINPSKYYTTPRLFLRGEMLKIYQTKQKNKGILLMVVQGQHIVGHRGIAIANGTSIQWWMTRSQQYQGIIGEKQPPEMIQQQKVNVVPPVEPYRSNQELRLQHKFVGHSGLITALSISLDQFYLISAGIENIIKLWCLRSKMLLTQYKGHANSIWSLDFCESGYFFLSASGDKTIKLWKTDSPFAIRTYIGHKGDVYKVKFLKNPDYIISSSSDRTVRVWTLEKAECIRIIKFEKQVINFTISFSGRYLVVCQNDGTMTFSDLISGQQINCFNLFFLKKKKQENQKIKYPIHDMSFSLDESEFACISKKEIALYSVDAMKQKMPTDIYEEIKDEKSVLDKQKDLNLRPKEVLDFGTEQLNLVYCNYHPKNYLVVAGKK